MLELMCFFFFCVCVCVRALRRDHFNCFLIPAESTLNARTHTHTKHISSSIANLTASWYFIKIKYSEPNISAPASVSPLAFAVLLLAVIKQCCIVAGAPFWIGGELPVFIVRHHAPNRDACTMTVRYEYMYRATPNIYVCNMSQHS